MKEVIYSLGFDVIVLSNKLPFMAMFCSFRRRTLNHIVSHLGPKCVVSWSSGAHFSVLSTSSYGRDCHSSWDRVRQELDLEAECECLPLVYSLQRLLEQPAIAPRFGTLYYEIMEWFEKFPIRVPAHSLDPLLHLSVLYEPFVLTCVTS